MIRQVWVTEDGEQFEFESDAEAHEKKLKRCERITEMLGPFADGLDDDDDVDGSTTFDIFMTLLPRLVAYLEASYDQG